MEKISILQGGSTEWRGSIYSQEDQCEVRRISVWFAGGIRILHWLCAEAVSSCIYHTHVLKCRLTVSSCIYHTHVPLYRDWQCPFVFSTVMSLCTETDSVQLYLPCSCPYVQRLTLTVSNCILPHSCPSVQRLCPVYHTHGPLYRGWLCPVVFGNWAWYSVDNYLRLLWVWVSNPTAVANIRVWESFFFGWRGFQTTLESPKYDHHRNQWK